MLAILRNQYFYLLLIIIAGLFVRLIKIDSPIADWHSWRQSDTVAVTRSFIKEGFNPLYPKYEDFSGVAEMPIPNLGRFRFVEFPIYNIATLPLYVLFGANDLYSRLVSVLFSLGSAVFIFLLTKRYLDIFNSLVASFIFTFLPFNVFFSRTTLPEPTFIFLSLGMLYFTDRWIWENKKSLFYLGFIFTALAFLVKPWAVFFALPLLYSFFKKEGRIWPIPKKYLAFLLSLVPFLLWRVWILQYPEGIPASNWLANGDGIRFKPAFWRWIFGERLGKEILGVGGFGLLLIGLLARPKGGSYFLHIWLLSAFLFVVIFATGSVKHNYYQVQLIPILSIFASVGFVNLIKGFNSFIARFWTIVLGVGLFILMFYLTFLPVKEFYKINNPPIIEAGIRADQILPSDARVIAPYNGDSAFLYQTNRNGWPATYLPIREMILNYGATHFVSVSYDAKTRWVMDHFLVLEQTPKYTIVDLTNLQKPFALNEVEP